MTAATLAGLAIVGVAVGAFGTLVGAGGGFILTPLLLVLYPKDTPKTITAISLVVVFFNAASGSIAYGRLRRIDYRSGVVLALATLPGAVAGALVVQYAVRRVFDPLMGVLLIGLAILAIRGPRPRQPDEAPGGTSRVITDRTGATYRYRVPLLRGGLLSVGVGFVSSFLGIGGGVIHVPLLVSLLDFPTHIATATSHFVLAGMSGVASVTHALTGSFAQGHGLRRALALSVGVVLGAQLGARVSSRASGVLIRRLLAGALTLLAVRLLIQTAM